MRSPWLTKRAISLHVALIIVLPSFALLCNWQLDRALSGNGLSWAYTFEWPIFGLYAIYMWWRIIHDDTYRHSTSRLSFRHAGERDRLRSERQAQQDADLASYNAYLASLASQDDHPAGEHNER